MGVVVRIAGAEGGESHPESRQLAGFAFRVSGLGEVDELMPVRVPHALLRGVSGGRLPEYARFTKFAPGDRNGEGVVTLNVPPRLAENGAWDPQASAVHVHRWLAEHLAPFKDSEIAEFSPRVLARDGTRLDGKYTLTAEDILGAKKFADGVVKSAWPIEIWDQRRGPVYRFLSPGNHYEIPRRCLLSRKIRNLICAGKCISLSEEALGSTRVAGTCLSLGEQAGVAAGHLLGRVVS